MKVERMVKMLISIFKWRKNNNQEVEPEFTDVSLKIAIRALES